MTVLSAAYVDVSYGDGRQACSGGLRRASRRFVGGSLMMLGAVAGVGVLIAGLTLAAGFMASSDHSPKAAFGGPGTLALAPYEPLRQRAEQERLAAAARTIIQTPVSIARLGPADMPVAQPAPQRHAAIPLPKPYPQQLARARAKDAAPTAAHATDTRIVAAATADITGSIPKQVAFQAQPLAEIRMGPKLVGTVEAKVERKPEFKIERPTTKLAMLDPAQLPAAKLDIPPPLPRNSAAPDGVARTTVYDIAGKAVYLPDGQKLEAHSGLGERMDDARYIKLRMRGPTPPNVYVLTERESLFHGVRAVRLNPVDKARMHGRDGILAHSYLLGPNGQSNGCVSFKDYDKFLEAFLEGKVDKMVVVADLGNTSWRTAALEADGVNVPSRRFASQYSRPRNFLAKADDMPSYRSALSFASSDRGPANW